MVEVADNHISLTEKEQEIFDLLLSVAIESKSGTILRVVGGWVRDKLLGAESNDIDIAIDMPIDEFS